MSLSFTVIKISETFTLNTNEASDTQERISLITIGLTGKGSNIFNQMKEDGQQFGAGGSSA